jgi:hypothetical protein
VVFFYSSVHVSLPRALDKGPELGISGEELNWQLLSVAQVCISSFSQALSPTLELLCIYDLNACWQGENRERPMVGTFTPIYLCEEHLLILGNFAIYCARPGRAATEVLPALQSLIFSWRSSTHCDLSRKPLRSSLPHVNSPIALELFLTGTKSRIYGRRLKIDQCFVNFYHISVWHHLLTARHCSWHSSFDSWLDAIRYLG